MTAQTSEQQATPRTEIIAVVPSAEFINNPLSFERGQCYLVSDARPFIDIQYTTNHPPKVAGPGHQTDGELKAIVERPGWIRWDLAKHLSADRRIGLHELALKVPTDTTLRCYVLPGKLVSIADVWSLIEEMEQELDRPIAWSDDRRRTIRSWVQGDRRAERSNSELLIDETTEELACTQALRRNPPLEPGLSRHRLTPVPELSLISHWAIRRGQALADVVQRMDQEHAALEQRAREHHPKNRKREFDERRRNLESKLNLARQLHSQVIQQVQTVEIGSPVSLGPLVQRDPRFRQLLRVFAPRTSEIASTEPGRWSRLPPVSINRLFECWGAIWLVKQLRLLGFQGGVETMVGAQDIVGCRFVLKRDDLKVTLDYEPHPARLDLTDLPSLDERLTSSEEWAIGRQFSDPDRPFFGGQDRCSPDYLLRIEGPGRAVFAIGDACLADPSYHDKDDKLETLRAYRRSILWKSGNGLVRCEPLGLFALYPGPTSRWQSLEPSFRKDDVWLLCPEARSTDEHAQQRVSRMLNHLLTTAMGTSALQANR